jgi:hypothetical protein
MTPDGFLTFLALMVAVYAVATPVARLRVRLDVRWLQKVVALCAFGLVLYFLSFDAWKRPCPPALGGMCEWITFSADGSFAPAQAAFLVVLVWVPTAWLIHGLSKPSPSSLSVLSTLVDDLLHETRYAELLALVEPHLPLIDKAARRRLPLQRLHDYLAAVSGIGDVPRIVIAGLAEERQRDRTRLSAGFAIVVSRLRFLIPRQSNIEKYAEHILRGIYRTDGLRRFMVGQRPYAAIPLLWLDQFEKRDFSARFFGDLIADEGSVLYQEVRENQWSGPQGYLFPASNRLLHFLFSDAEVSNHLGVWKPIGDYVRGRLDVGVDPGYVARLNGPDTRFEEECWSDSTYVGIQFFRIMVTAAAYQGISWHMWLYYLPLFLEKLEESYDTSSPLVDVSAEFPNRAARLVYEIVDALGDFVGLATRLPEASPHRDVPEGSDLPNGNISFSAAVALGQCAKTIAMSDRFGERLATYLHECVLRDVSRLPRDGDLGKLRAFLVDAVVHGGDTFRWRSEKPAYGPRLAHLLEGADHVLWSDGRDYLAAINTAYPDALSDRLKSRL